MKLSVIVPVYNVEKFLPRCLDSLLRQGMEVGEWEVICVNDGSSDGSANILAEYDSIEKVQKYMLTGVDKAVMAADDGKDAFFRYGTPHMEARRNSTAISGLKGLTYYWSLADREENDYFIEMGLPAKNDFNYRNVNDVTSLTDLASVKYYVIESKKGRRLKQRGMQRQNG